MPRGNLKKWTDEYERQCFDAWYLGGRPHQPYAVQEMIPESENNEKPSIPVIKRWLNESWFFRADELDARINEEADLALVNQKVALLKLHQEQAAQVKAKALAYIIQEGFDSSASAVQAFFRGMEEERKVAGFSDLLEKLEKMTNNQVRDQIINLINRATENNQIVESGTTDLAGVIEDGIVEEE